MRKRILRACASEDRWLLLEAFALIVSLRLGLRILPFTTVRRCVSRWTHRDASDRRETEGIVCAVSAVGSRMRGTTCLVEAMTAESMLGRHGHAATLMIGVRRGAGMPVDAHAWVECGGAVVIGKTADMADYAVLSATAPRGEGRLVD